MPEKIETGLSHENTESLMLDALEKAQDISRSWFVFLKIPPKELGVILALDPDLNDIYTRTEGGKTGIQKWFEAQLDLADQMANGDVDSKNVYIRRIIIKLGEYKNKFNELLEKYENK